MCAVVTYLRVKEKGKKKNRPEEKKETTENKTRKQK
jgi:hypothetical protein